MLEGVAQADNSRPLADNSKKRGYGKTCASWSDGATPDGADSGRGSGKESTISHCRPASHVTLNYAKGSQPSHESQRPAPPTDGGRSGNWQRLATCITGGYAV
jgi:hypothetical protein